MSGDKEIAAMGAIAAALDQFSEEDHQVISRILKWANARYSVTDIDNYAHDNSGKKKKYSNESAGGLEECFEDIAELYHATDPKTEGEKALIAGYWLTVSEGQNDFTGADANVHLKNLGHGIGNITDALSKMMRRKPSLVMQVAKGGASKQARKKYKLTRAGQDYVRRMFSNVTLKSEEEVSG